jgi:hypothetical protein
MEQVFDFGRNKNFERESIHTPWGRAYAFGIVQFMRVRSKVALCALSSANLEVGPFPTNSRRFFRDAARRAGRALRHPAVRAQWEFF